jgi:hypothetical protein
LPVPERARQRILELADKEQKRRKKRISSVDEFRQAYPELTFIIDGVEQPKRKPKAPKKRKSDYSGKKSGTLSSNLSSQHPPTLSLTKARRLVDADMTSKSSKMTWRPAHCAMSSKTIE